MKINRTLTELGIHAVRWRYTQRITVSSAGSGDEIVSLRHVVQCFVARGYEEFSLTCF